MTEDTKNDIPYVNFTWMSQSDKWEETQDLLLQAFRRIVALEKRVADLETQQEPIK